MSLVPKYFSHNSNVVGMLTAVKKALSFQIKKKSQSKKYCETVF